MKAVVRRTLKVLLVVAIVLVALLVGVLLFLGPIIKTAAEKAGPLVLGVPVTVEKVSVNAFGGSFGLKNLRVGNLPGYSSDPMVSLGELRVAVKIASLPGTGPIEVKEITILAPKFSYEVAKGVSNVDALMARMQKKAPAGEAAGKAEASQTQPPKVEPPRAQPAQTAQASQETPAPKKEARKVIIDRFECRGGEVSFRAGMTFGKAICLPLPPIVANDIGKSSGGTSTADAIQKMFGEIANGVGKAVVGVAGAVGDAGKAALNGVQDAGSTVKDAGKNVVKKLGDLF